MRPRRRPLRAHLALQTTRRLAKTQQQAFFIFALTLIALAGPDFHDAAAERQLRRPIGRSARTSSRAASSPAALAAQARCPQQCVDGSSTQPPSLSAQSTSPASISDGCARRQIGAHKTTTFSHGRLVTLGSRNILSRATIAFKVSPRAARNTNTRQRERKRKHSRKQTRTQGGRCVPCPAALWPTCRCNLASLCAPHSCPSHAQLNHTQGCAETQIARPPKVSPARPMPLAGAANGNTRGPSASADGRVRIFAPLPSVTNMSLGRAVRSRQALASRDNNTASPLAATSCPGVQNSLACCR